MTSVYGIESKERKTSAFVRIDPASTGLDQPQTSIKNVFLNFTAIHVAFNIPYYDYEISILIYNIINVSSENILFPILNFILHVHMYVVSPFSSLTLLCVFIFTFLF